MGIFGYGFSEITDFFDPPFTVINQDPQKLGLEAIKLLLTEIGEKVPGRKTKICIDVEFLWRKSILRKVNN